MTSKEFANQVRDICSNIEKQPWNKAGIYKNPPKIDLCVGLELYEQIMNDENHPVRQLINQKK